MSVTIFGLWNRLYNPIELCNGLCDILIKKKRLKLRVRLSRERKQKPKEEESRLFLFSNMVYALLQVRVG